MKHTDKSIKGFTLIELLVVISIIGLLSSVAIASLSTARMKARDMRRLADMRTVQTALEFYLDKYGVFPNSDGAGVGTFDTPGNGTFIEPLVTEGFLKSEMRDPVKNDFNGNYLYYRYTVGWGTNNCDNSRGGYYVLMVADMETSTGKHQASEGFACAGRDWTSNGDWVSGRYEK